MIFIIGIIIIISAFTAGYYFSKNKIQIIQRQIDSQYEIDKQQVEQEISLLKEQKTSMQNNISDLKKQAQESADIFYEQSMALANHRINADLDIQEKRYETLVKQYEEEYLSAIEDLSNQFTNTMAEKRLNIQALETKIETSKEKLEDLRKMVSAAVESNKRAEDSQNERNFYRCQISEADIEEIKKLRQIEPYLRDKRPLCKVIWESYYRDSCSALLGRVVGDVKTAGIYKITNLTNDKIYIGQAVNISDRLKTHIKAGIGIDTPNNKMYQDMKNLGVENFSFEILEKCPQSELNTKEKFWINFYHGQDYGYNITKGGS